MSTTVNLDIKGMVKRFEFLGAALRPSIYRAMLVSGQKMRTDVVAKRMSGPRGAEGMLGVVTGAARRSMTDETGVAGNTIYTLFGSALGYVKVHEEGYDNPAQAVRAHTRRRLGQIKAVSIAKATRYKVIKRAAPSAAQRRAGLIQVKAHTRHAHFEAKHFIADTLILNAVPTQNRIKDALIIAAATGRLPTASELGG